jgi:hypothetical protein
MRGVFKSLLVVSLLANGALAYYLIELRQDFNRGEATLDRKVAEAESEIVALAEQATAGLDVDAVRDDLRNLQRHLIGLSPLPPGESDRLGRMEDDLDKVSQDLVAVDRRSRGTETDLQLLKGCINRGFNTLDNNFRELLAYVARVFNNSFAAAPRTLVPSCF